MGDCACDVTVDQLNPSAPLSFFFLELTPACNNACPGCGNVFANDRSRSPFSAPEWASVVERLAPYQPRLRLTGGEPTMHPEFEQIVRYVQAMGFPFTIFSNARWQDPAKTLHFFSSASGLEGILVSLHGARAESHEAFTATPGSFTETVTNIHRAENAGVRVVTSTVITHQNYQEVEDTIALSQELGADHAVFSRYVGRPLLGIEASEQELRAAVQAVENVGNGNGRVRFGSPVPHCFVSNHSNGCMSGFVHVTIDPWGNVRPCPHTRVTAGNVLNGDGLEAILQSPVMERWRQGLLAQCGDCAEQSSCFAGCQAMALARGLDRDPLIQAHA
ncbi:MAG: radical SAM protein [Chloroflexi bacterium]|nr:radical SAM protein [Chloroflexota bacterium]